MFLKQFKKYLFMYHMYESFLLNSSRAWYTQVTDTKINKQLHLASYVLYHKITNNYHVSIHLVNQNKMHHLCYII